jgi:hypothetical protein
VPVACQHKSPPGRGQSIAFVLDTVLLKPVQLCSAQCFQGAFAAEPEAFIEASVLPSAVSQALRTTSSTLERSSSEISSAVSRPSSRSGSGARLAPANTKPENGIHIPCRIPKYKVGVDEIGPHLDKCRDRSLELRSGRTGHAPRSRRRLVIEEPVSPLRGWIARLGPSGPLPAAGPVRLTTGCSGAAIRCLRYQTVAASQE